MAKRKYKIKYDNSIADTKNYYYTVYRKVLFIFWKELQEFCTLEDAKNKVIELESIDKFNKEKEYTYDPTF